MTHARPSCTKYYFYNIQFPTYMRSRRWIVHSIILLTSLEALEIQRVSKLMCSNLEHGTESGKSAKRGVHAYGGKKR